MSHQTNPFGIRARRLRSAWPAGVKIALGKSASALRRAVILDQRTIVRIGGKDVAVIPLRDFRRLERLLEQEEKAKETELDRLDVEEAERRLRDPNDATIPYEQVRRELGLD